MKTFVSALLLAVAASPLCAGEAVPERLSLRSEAKPDSPTAETPVPAKPDLPRHSKATPGITTLTTLDGRSYHGIASIKAFPNKLRIIHESGAVTLRFDQLPEEIRERFGYDPEQAAAADRADAAAAARQAELLRAEDAQLAAIQAPRLKKSQALQQVRDTGYGTADYWKKDRDFRLIIRGKSLKILRAAGYREDEALAALKSIETPNRTIPEQYRKPTAIHGQLRGVPSGTHRHR
jgi:hypothetical protein